MSVRIFAFAGSLRKNSWNRKLLAQASALVHANGGTLTEVDLNDYVLPFYNAEIEDVGFPKAADELKALVDAHDAVMIVSPEYNHSFPAVVKNTIDWVSRYRPNPLRGKPATLLSASPGMVGGNRGLWQLRQPLESLGMHVHPSMFSLANAASAFADDGTLADPALQRRLEENIIAFLQHVERMQR